MYNKNYLATYPDGAKSATKIQKCLHFVSPFFIIKNLISLNSKLENKKWWQKAPPHTINKGFKGKIPLLGQHLDGDISNAYLAVTPYGLYEHRKKRLYYLLTIYGKSSVLLHRI